MCIIYKIYINELAFKCYVDFVYPLKIPSTLVIIPEICEFELPYLCDLILVFLSLYHFE